MTSRCSELVSASMRTLFVAVAASTLSGCSPVYTFRFPSDTQPEIDAMRLEARLETALSARGFESIGFTDRATGDIGCGRNAPDRTTFQKALHGASFQTGHRWLWVHEFSCEAAWHVVIVSSRNASREAAQLRDSLSAEFEPEIAAYGLRVETRRRLALE